MTKPMLVSEHPFWFQYGERNEADLAYSDAAEKVRELRQQLAKANKTARPQIKAQIQAAETEEAEAKVTFEEACKILDALPPLELPDLVGSPKELAEAREARQEWLVYELGSILYAYLPKDWPGRAWGIGTLIDLYAAKTDARWWIRKNQRDPHLFSMIRHIQEMELPHPNWDAVFAYARKDLGMKEAKLQMIPSGDEVSAIIASL